MIYVRRALEFASFPTVLLGATLLRLGLNVASTRVVLIRGHTGAHAAGHVIAAFGQFVVGGNYAVGLVVFTVLVIINFVVITKGAGRISEVSARFTLDAMPGRQMAIDADLNAGIITQAEAIVRRQEVREEADFYGAMDGASKFVRGDAIAGILIVFINLFGGILIGAMQHGMSLSDAGHTYALLTIGDGLVAQIPALLLSVAVAILVTRVSRPHDMSQQIMSQVFGHARALGVTAGILTLARHHSRHAEFRVSGHGRRMRGGRVRSPPSAVPTRRPPRPRRPSPPRCPSEQRELSWDDVESVDAVGLEVGYRLIPLVDRAQGGELMGRIKGVRKKLSEELGFLVQPVHIRDNLELGPNSYRITILGAPVGESEVFPDRELAINPGQVSGTLPGSATKDPAFGLDAVWIDKSRRDQAQAQGYTVVDAGSVIATHLSHLLQSHAHELLGSRGSAAAPEPARQERAEAGRGSGAEDPAHERGREGVAAAAARARAHPQRAHRLRDARGARPENAGSRGAGCGGARRAWGAASCRTSAACAKSCRSSPSIPRSSKCCRTRWRPAGMRRASSRASPTSSSRRSSTERASRRPPASPRCSWSRRRSGRGSRA